MAKADDKPPDAPPAEPPADVPPAEPAKPDPPPERRKDNQGLLARIDTTVESAVNRVFDERLQVQQSQPPPEAKPPEGQPEGTPPADAEPRKQTMAERMGF